MASTLAVAVAPQEARAHGAWLGNCQVDFSASTVAEIQARVNAGDEGIGDGDFIEFIASCPVIVDGTLSGPGGYVTFYTPSGTEIAGAWIVNAAGAAINARPATSAVSGEGISRGWGPKDQNTFVTTPLIGWNPSSTAACVAAGYTAADCNGGLAFIYGDTGIFYSTRSDTAMYTGGAASLSVTNGYQTNPTNAKPWPTVGGSGNERVHNRWDAVQTNAFGASSVIDNGFTTAEQTRISEAGRGAVPFNAGSPVAGPNSGVQWDRNGTTGPWNRISYAGSCFANDPTISGTEGPANDIGSVVPQAPIGTANSVSVCTPTIAGFALSDASPLPVGTNAVRFAVGGITSGETHRVRIRLRVTSAATLGLANFEGHGGDSTQGAAAGNDNPWRYWVGAPGVAAAGSERLFINKDIVAVNGAPYNGTTIPPGATVRYRISYTNAYTLPQTNVQVSDVLPSQATGTNSFTVISGPNIVPASLPTSGTFNFLTIASLPPGSGVVEFNVTTSAAAGQTVTNQARINSAQVPTLQTDLVATNVITPVPPVAANNSIADINGATGAADVVNAFSGDTIGGVAASSSNTTLAVASGSTLPAGLTFDTATGNVSVVAGTAPGTYSFNYTICDRVSPTYCSNATIAVTVVGTPIIANTDSATGINGASGTANVLNVLGNDEFNGATASTSSVTISVTAPSSHAGVSLDTATGQVSVAAGTPAETYTIGYRICESAYLANCSDSIATITVAPSTDLAVEKSDGVSSAYSGDTVTYTVTVTNTGPDAATGALVTDVVGARLSCPAGNAVTITGSGVPSGSYTISNLIGAGITLGTLSNGQSAILSYSCQVN